MNEVQQPPKSAKITRQSQNISCSNIPLLGCEEAEKRHQLRYKGKSPRRRVPDNLNYLDHNILNLDGRIEKEMKYYNRVEHPFYQFAEGVPKRSLSQPGVNSFF